ncbi:phage tail spike protein [Limosilactobacillus fermentum]|nr:phage tail spike protein [Limosilactobacillus fermentum]MCZ2327496.1 phage tail protein [Limosilactobacillus fermentum]
MYLLDKKQRVRRWLKDNDFIEAEMTEEINAANQINFSTPLKDRIADNIYYVAIPTPRSKQKYLLFKLLSERVQNDRIEYQGIEEAYDELKQYGYIKDIRPNDRTAEEMLKMVLEPTRWTLGNVTETSHQSTNLYYITYLEALQKIVGLFNIELTFEVTIDPKSNKITRRQVNIYTEQGQRTGKRFEYGSNLLTVQQEQDSQELITALVGRGKGELVSEGHDDTPDGYGRRITFADVVWTKKDGNPVDKPAGQEYLIDPEATALYGFSDGNPRIGLTVFEDIEDPVELINATWRALQSLKRPKVSFKADVTDVGQLGLGDTVAIIRHDLKIEYLTRVYKVKHNLLNENDNQIELGDDFSGHSITSSLIKVDEIANEARETAGHAAIAANGKNNNYYSSVQPLAPVEGDIWYKDLGNGETDMYQYHNGGWVFIQSTRDLHVVENQVKEAQQGLNQAKADIINNKQKADADIENLNKSIEANKKVADESLQKLNDSVTNLQGQYDNNVVPNLNKVMADASDALQKYITAQNSIADLTRQAQEQGKDIADVSNTVKGLNINYANLAEDVNSTKVDVKGLQTTIGTANGDIAQLKLDAQNLQTMLAGKVDNTTYTNFVNLTNQALNARLTASDLNGYAKTVDVQATANGLRVDLNSVTDRMNNLRVGTSNLLHHSDTFDGWGKGNSVTVTSDKYLNGTIAVLGNTGIDGGSQIETFLDGPYDNQPVTWTVYAKADNVGDKLHTELWGGGGRTNQPLTNNWQVYQFTGQRNTDHSQFYLWGWQGNKGNIYVALPFAVVGNAIGTWEPNASDINHELNELSAQVNITNQQFNSYYTKSETDSKTDTAKNDAVNAIKGDANWAGLTNIITNSGFLQTADGFVQKVNQTTSGSFNALQTQLTQTAKTIRQEVSDKTSGLQTQITQQANSFNVSLNALRNETAWQKVTTAIDANNYTTTGNYWIQAVSNANTPDNSSWAYLQVVAYPDVKRVKQTWQRDDNENQAYTRLLVNDNWTSWQRTVTGGNIMAQINMSAGTTLIQNNKIYMDADSTIFSGKAFIPSAAISNLSADKITTGTLNAGLINVINLNASSITTGTINGANLKIDLNNGEVQFKRGRITSIANTLNINIDTGTMSVTDGVNNGVYFANGELKLMDDPLNITGTPKYGGLRRSAHIWSPGSAGAELHSPNGVFVGSDNYNGAFAGGSGIDGTSSGAALAVDKDGSATLNGANIVSVSGGRAYDIGYSMKNRPAIILGKSQSGWNPGDRTFIQGAFVHIESAYRNTNGASPNVYVAPDGALVRSTSASKYKTDIQRSYVSDYGERLLELPTATWMDKAETERYVDGESQDKPVRHFGMIAEDLADAGLEMLVSRGQDGELEGIQYDRIGPALIPVIKQLQDKVNKLEEKLNER